MKNQKGITLIALIITIIVMLILVGVSVTVALNGGLFNTAKDAADKTKAAIKEETEALQYKYQIAKANGEYSGSYDLYVDEYILQTQYGLRIGDKVAYDETDGTPLPYETDDDKGIYASIVDPYMYEFTSGTYTINGENETIAAGDLEWRVLGLNESGQVELISTTPTASTIGIFGLAGAENIETKNGELGTLDTFCNNLYGKGKGAASARSLVVEDINKLANYTPLVEKYTYKWYPTDDEYGASYGIASKDITNDNRDNVTGWYYMYSDGLYVPGYDLDFPKGGATEVSVCHGFSYKLMDRIKKSAPIDIASLITKGEGNTDFINQWLASKTLDSWLNCDITLISEGEIGTFLRVTEQYGYDYGESFAVRPVVTLNANVEFTDNDSNGIFEINV